MTLLQIWTCYINNIWSFITCYTWKNFYNISLVFHSIIQQSIVGSQSSFTTIVNLSKFNLLINMCGNQKDAWGQMVKCEMEIYLYQHFCYHVGSVFDLNINMAYPCSLWKHPHILYCPSSVEHFPCYQKQLVHQGELIAIKKLKHCFCFFNATSVLQTGNCDIVFSNTADWLFWILASVLHLFHKNEHLSTSCCPYC